MPIIVHAIPRLSMPDSFEEFQRYVSWTQYLYEKINRKNTAR